MSLLLSQIGAPPPPPATWVPAVPTIPAQAPVARGVAFVTAPWGSPPAPAAQDWVPPSPLPPPAQPAPMRASLPPTVIFGGDQPGLVPPDLLLTPAARAATIARGLPARLVPYIAPPFAGTTVVTPPGLSQTASIGGGGGPGHRRRKVHPIGHQEPHAIVVNDDEEVILGLAALDW